MSMSEQVMRERGGAVLGKKTILKSDHFPGCHNKRMASPHIAGAPNYRQAGGSLHVHGVAIPTILGIRNVLSHIGALNSSRVLWINLREEPVSLSHAHNNLINFFFLYIHTVSRMSFFFSFSSNRWSTSMVALLFCVMLKGLSPTSNTLYAI